MLAVLWLAACQPMPQPFATDHAAGGNPLLRLADRAGVVVLEIDGPPAPVAAALRRQMAAALLERNVPAWTRSGNRGSLFLQGQARTRNRADGSVEVELAWELFDPAGREVGRHAVVGSARPAEWENGEAGILKSLASDSAKGIARLIQGPAPGDALTSNTLHVAPVAGAPGDGRRSLRLAMMAALRKAGIRVTPEIENDGLVIAGGVSLQPAGRGQQTIEIVWTLLRPDGTEIGNLKQRNTVPAAAVNGIWGELAFLVAEAAVGGVVDLLRTRTEIQNAARDR